MIRSALMLWGCVLVAGAALPCSLVVDETHPRPTPQSLVRDADAIVIATAIRTIDPPNRGHGVPALPADAFDVAALVNGTVEFRIDETIKGEPDYRAGGRYLLLLKRSRAGALTPYSAGRQPVNGQLHDGADPWLLWVREQVAAK
jgi:hypothetical protein